jgi:hypothetical protein
VGLRQRVTLQEPHHHIPRYPSPLRAATQPLAPRGDNSVAEVALAPRSSGDTEIPKVPQQLLLSAAHCSRTGSCRYRRHQSAMGVRSTTVSSTGRRNSASFWRRIVVNCATTILSARNCLTGEPPSVAKVEGRARENPAPICENFSAAGNLTDRWRFFRLPGNLSPIQEAVNNPLTNRLHLSGVCLQDMH